MNQNIMSMLEADKIKYGCTHNLFNITSIKLPLETLRTVFYNITSISLFILKTKDSRLTDTREP